MHKSSILLASLVLSALPAVAQTPADSITSAPDSIPDQKLGELVVTAERGWFEDGKANFIPTKREKQFSNSPASLIDAMHLPMLDVKDGTIGTIDGKSVSIFIDGVPADDIDMKSFVSKDVKRVEYIVNPTDPRFNGAERVINFIMVKYLVGGATNLYGFYGYPGNHVSGTVSSKLVYKKMTYGILLDGSRTNVTGNKNIGEFRYNDIYYAGKLYDEIAEQKYENYSWEFDDFVFAVNARYNTTNFWMRHTFSLNDEGLDETFDGTSTWSENLFDSEHTWRDSRSSDLSPQINGTYNYQIHPKLHLSAGWTYLHSDKHATQNSIFGQAPEIYNSTDENIDKFTFGVRPTFNPNRFLTFQISMDYALTDYLTAYAGTSDARMNLRNQTVKADFTGYWRPSGKFSLLLRPGLTSTLMKIGDVSRSQVDPTFDTSVNWQISRRLSFTAYSYYRITSPSSQQSNSAPVQLTPLLWTVGNPYLKNTDHTYYSASLSYLPSNWLNIGLSYGLSHVKNLIVDLHEAAPAEMGGLLSSNINAPDYNSHYFNLNINARFLDNRLNFRFRPRYEHEHCGVGYFRNLDEIGFHASGEFSFGDFRFELEYRSPSKYLGDSGMSKSFRKSDLNATLTFSRGNLYIRAQVGDFFHRYSWTRTLYRSPNYNYDSSEALRSFGRRFSLSFTYTFGWGKKVDQNIDISSGAGVESSVRK
ncbi:MAG: outer membrane beta-barrel protein [Muribaculaceae bacterium]|nr:outer membrane beta-barrel protein [Muribaculaceae bacterium]